MWRVPSSILNRKISTSKQHLFELDLNSLLMGTKRFYFFNESWEIVWLQYFYDWACFDIRPSSWNLICSYWMEILFLIHASAKKEELVMDFVCLASRTLQALRGINSFWGLFQKIGTLIWCLLFNFYKIPIID